MVWHGDEGRGKIKRAIMIESFAPVLAPRNHSFCSRLLHSIVPGECYANDDTLSRLHDAMAIDLKALFWDGFEAGSTQYT